MRIIANIFLLLFFADSGISLIDEIVSLAAPLPPLAVIRNLLANAVVLTSVPLYLSLGVDRRLPKMIFLPMIIFVFSCLSCAWVFPSLPSDGGFGLLIAAIQVGLSLVIILHLRKENGQPTLADADFYAPFFSLKNTLAFTAINLLLAPLVLSLLLFGSARAFIEENATGFMRLAPEGLHMTEKVYSRGNKTIRLAAMIHLGEKAYYDELTRSFASGRTIVLAEGVTDEKNLLRERLDYGKLADFLGLTTQERLQFKGRFIGDEDLEEAPADGEGEAVRESADVLRADVDISSFHPETIHFLDALGRQLKENSSTVQGLLAFNDWSKKNVTPQTHKIVMDDILYGRNKELIRNLRKAVGRYDSVIIPWGALHMPEIEKEVVKEGFQLREQRERLSIDLKKLLWGG